MSFSQYEYSTLSTSLTQSELGSTLVANMLENPAIIEEDTVSTTSSNSETVNSPQAPKDRFNIVYLTLGLLGLSTLLPWNFLITANDYWMCKFQDLNSTDPCYKNKSSSLQTSFASYLAISYNIPYVTTLILCMIFSKTFSYTRYTVGSLLAMSLAFTAITTFVKINTESWQYSFFILTMLLVVFLGIASAIMQTATSAMASILPPKYMHIMVLGQAVAGLLASLTQILAVVGHHNAYKDAFGYFLCAVVVLLCTLCTYTWTQRTEYFQFYVSCSDVPDDTVLKDLIGGGIKVHVSVSEVTKQIWPYAASATLIFWVTIGIFPGLAVLVRPMNRIQTTFTGPLFLPVTCFLLFNASDFAGRIIGGWWQMPISRRHWLFTACCLRCVLIPIFMLCNAKPRSPYFPVVFNSDIYFIVFITILGFTNGLFITMALIKGSKYLAPQFQKLSGIILSTFLGIGLMLGAVSSYMFIHII